MKTHDINTLSDIQKLVDNPSLIPNEPFSLILEKVSGDKIRFHIVERTGKRVYQQHLSIDAFCWRELKDFNENYYSKRKQRPRHFQDIKLHDIAFDSIFQDIPMIKYKWKEHIKESEIQHHANVWDFYKAKSIDHTKRNFTSV